jgi:hypothetical protein
MNSDEHKKDILDKFRHDFKNKSFSGRHPELGRMINCGVCETRHRASQLCKQKFVTEAPTRKTVNGALPVKGKRIRPHHSKRNLQLIERTRILFPQYSNLEPEEAMKKSRCRARQQLADEAKQKSIRERSRQHISRHINRGLLEGSAV